MHMQWAYAKLVIIILSYCGCVYGVRKSQSTRYNAPTEATHYIVVVHLILYIC